jgi:cytosine/adenosine deaminase-related metal-dependent hydrolase
MAVTAYRSRWVLPVTTPPILDGVVVVDGERIAAVGPAPAIELPAEAAVEDLGDVALLPGLVDIHAHPELAMFRGALEDLPFRDWILRLVGAKRGAILEADYECAARWSMIEAMRAGITTLAVTESSGASLGALQESGLRGLVYQEVFGPDPAVADESLHQLREVLGPLRRLETERVRIGVSPHAPYTVSDRLFAATAEWAIAEALPMAVHAAESAVEGALVREGAGDFAPGLGARGIATPVRGRSTIELLDRLGVLAARPLLIHCVDVDADDIMRIAASGAAVAHCPVANAKLGHGVAPIIAMREAGIRVGLGTDSVGSNNRLDLLEEARFAALLQRATHHRFDLLGPDDLLRLCTLDGATALGWEGQLGSLEPGKAADLCAVALSGPHVRPVHHPVAALFHSARGSDVVLTVVGGRVVYRDGMVMTLDVEAFGAGVEGAAARLRESMGGSA